VAGLPKRLDVARVQVNLRVRSQGPLEVFGYPPKGLKKTEQTSSTLNSLLFSETELTDASSDSIHPESIDRQNTRTQLWEIWFSVVPKDRAIRRTLPKFL